MDVDITIKNYRAFTDESPARISLRQGFTSLIGANNSGKSSILRLFYEFRTLFTALTLQDGVTFNSFVASSRHFTSFNVADPDEIFSIANSRDLEVRFDFCEHELETPVPLLTRVSLRLRRDFLLKVDLFLPTGVVRAHPTHGLRVEGKHLIGVEPVADLSAMSTFFNSLATSMYVGPFRNVVGGSSDYFDMKLGAGFVEFWRQMKVGPRKKLNQKAAKVTEDVRKMFEFSSLGVNASEEGSTLQLYVNNRPFRLPETGAGLTQILTILATAAVKSPPYIFIDEPELNLHASLQSDFLTTLASYASEGIIFATHNVGLARQTSQRIYSVRKTGIWQSEVNLYEATPRLLEFLGELSFRGYKDLGYNTVLLVEGPTDVVTVQQFLRKYGKDHRVVMISMRGSNIINGSSDTEFQLHELTRVSDRVFALLDSERTSEYDLIPAQRLSFEKACSKAGIGCKILERRALEHYLSDAAVKAVKGNSYRALEPFEKRESVQPVWSKHENWRIAREMDVGDIRGSDLGQFLEKL